MMAMNPSPPPLDSPPAELTRLRQRVAELRAWLPGPGADYDPSPLATELQELLRSARIRSDARSELRQLLILLGRVELKRGQLTQARDLLIDGLAVDAGTAPDANELTRDHYLLAGVAGDLKSFQTAVEHYGKAAEFSKSATEFDANQRLGIRERFAFALHEAKRYAEACAANLELLEDAERLFGAHDHRLSTVLINTAQNLYALKKLAEAQSYLQRALDIAQARSDIEREQDLFYQLAVLASEQGRVAEARGYLAERVERLETGGPSKLMEAARRSLEHFDRNQARASLKAAGPP
jgi:tetratricopeptide (TPR) repeat protein